MRSIAAFALCAWAAFVLPSALAADYIQPWGTPGAAGRAATVGTAAVVLLPPQPNRITLSICDESATAQLAISFGGTAPAINGAGSYTIGDGQCAVWGMNQFVPPDSVNVIASASGTPITFEVQ
jgi:hypothetical protein